MKRIFKCCVHMAPADRADRETGAFYVDALIVFSVFIAVIFSFLAAPEVMVKKQELDYIAKTVARRIERDGMAGGALWQTIHELSGETGISPDVTWAGAFQGAESKIQIRDRFTVTVRFTVRVRLFEPSFGAPVYMDIPIQKTLSGVSEVYWKELA
ncbi:MAG: DUF4320 family protein [Oscillospiraceae bacterium]|nr:DUF4320 family protein [Oscillospiraceae bacterium]